MHSLFLPEFRVKQDAIPGQKVKIFLHQRRQPKEFLEDLNPSEEFVLWDYIADPENYDYEFLDFNGDQTAENQSSLRARNI